MDGKGNGHGKRTENCHRQVYRNAPDGEYPEESNNYGNNVEDAPNQGTDIDVNTVLPQSPNRNFHKSTCDTYTQHDHEHCFDETPAGTNKISRVNGKHRIRMSHIVLSVPPLRMKSTTGAATISGGMIMSIPNVSTIQPSSTLSLRRWISQRRRSRPILMAISVVIAMRKIRNVKSKLQIPPYIKSV